MDWVDELLGLTDEEPTPGGCDRCNAVQVLTPDPKHDGIFYLEIRHDHDCPFLRARQARDN